MTVSGNPLLFTKTAVLDSRKHRQWTIAKSGSFGHCVGQRFLPIILTEFSRIALEQPIVFVADEELIVPIVVLGLAADVNLFVDESGTWSGRYVPAYARMYPFILAPRQNRDDYSVCIDEGFSGFNLRTGVNLFDDNGDQSEFTENCVAFASEYQRQRERSLKFTSLIKKFDLLEQANFSVADESIAPVGGFMTINRQTLDDLPETDVLVLFKGGALELIYLQLASLSNFERLVSMAKP